MTLPVLSKTWQTGNCNVAQAALGSALTDNRGLLLAIKNAMIGFGSNPWTIGYSCNSVTAGTAGDGVDRWTTGTNLVWGGAGSAHSWIALKQAGISLGYQALISCEGAAGSGTLLTLVTSQSAGFTGGTTTARPTATDEVIVMAGVAWGGVLSVDQSARWSVLQSTDGQCTRIFVCAGGALTTHIFLDLPVNATAGWTNPHIGYGQNTPGSASLLVASSNLRARIAGATGNFGMGVEYGNNNYGPADTNFGNIANEVDGNWPIWPTSINCVTVGARGRHGTLQDYWLGSNNVPSGDSYPASGTTGQFAQFGAIITVWNNGPVNLS